MKLGAFSVSLAVKDLEKSLQFYEKLGFEVIGGQKEHNYLILRNADHTTIGLFQGMFDKNVLTFNPGWDAECNELQEFEDVRDIEAQLVSSGLTPVESVEPNSKGPGYFTLVDPDGNPVLVDQHV